jgi:hypothetical protein
MQLSDNELERIMVCPNGNAPINLNPISVNYYICGSSYDMMFGTPVSIKKNHLFYTGMTLII